MTSAEPWAEKWNLVEPLGAGGQGDTSLVTAVTGDQTRAVLKLLKPHKRGDLKARRRMFHEVANLKVLKSAGGKVPHIFDDNTAAFEQVGVPLFFVMELIEGKTLAKTITENTLPPGPSIGIALDLCSTMRFAIKEGIVHRDIKPENIIVRGLDYPDVFIIDFGLSFNEDHAAQVTEADEALDNKFLSLPERRGPGENKRDPRSDLTGICAILFYCMTGCSPRNLRDSDGRRPHRRPGYTLERMVPNKAQLSFINALLDTGLNYELNSRFQTIDDLVSRLEEARADKGRRFVESLETVVARESANLIKSDRATQLALFKSVASRFLMDVNNHWGLLMHTLAKSGSFAVQPYDLSMPKEGKWGGGEIICQGAIRVSIVHHPQIRRSLRYTTVAERLECVIYRQTVDEVASPVPTEISVSEPTVVLRYQGDTKPDYRLVVDDIESAIAESLIELRKKILPES